MKLIRTITLVFMAVVFFASCKKKDSIEILPDGILTFANLSVSPEFAKPIATKNENRIFSIGLKDGSILNFNLVSGNQTIFGKSRSLLGTVEINHVKEKAIMIIAENGFQLTYQHQNHMFSLKRNVILDLGYKQPTIDFLSDTIKAQVKAYTKQFGLAKTNSMIAIYNRFKNQPVTNDDALYEVAIEKSNNYTLLDQTLTEQKKQLAKGEMKCAEPIQFVTNTPNSQTFKPANDMAQSSFKTYNIEIALMESSFNLGNECTYLSFSLYSIDPSFTRISWFPSVSQLNVGSSFMDIVNLISALVPVSNAYNQLDNLTNYGINYNHPIPAGLCRIACYKKQWDNNLQGLGNVGTYSIYIRSVKSTLVVTDIKNCSLAHECGHNLGANHVNNSNDVMYYISGNSNSLHYDAANLKTMRATFGWYN